MFLFVLFCKVWRLPQVKFIKTPEVLGPALGQPTTSTSQLHPSCLRTLPNISRNITKQISPPSLGLTYISLSKLSHNNITSVSGGHDILVQAPTITWKKQSLFFATWLDSSTIWHGKWPEGIKKISVVYLFRPAKDWFWFHQNLSQ